MSLRSTSQRRSLRQTPNDSFRCEPVSDFSDCQNVPGPGGIGFEFPTQLGHVRVDRPAHDAGVVSPNFLKQIDTGHNASIALVESEEEIKLLWSQRDCCAIANDRAG